MGNDTPTRRCHERYRDEDVWETILPRGHARERHPLRGRVGNDTVTYLRYVCDKRSLSAPRVIPTGVPNRAKQVRRIRTSLLVRNDTVGPSERHTLVTNKGPREVRAVIPSQVIQGALSLVRMSLRKPGTSNPYWRYSKSTRQVLSSQKETATRKPEG